MPRKSPSRKQSLEQRLDMANAILASLPQSDETPTEFEFDHIDRSEDYYAGEYIVPDLEISLVRDIKQILRHLRRANYNGLPIVIGSTASFKQYGEVYGESIHYVCIQPFNVLIQLKASIGSLECENNLPVPIYGNIYFYADEAGLKENFDDFVKSSVKSSIDFSIRHIKEALSQMGERARAPLTRKALSRLEKLLP